MNQVRQFHSSVNLQKSKLSSDCPDRSASTLGITSHIQKQGPLGFRPSHRKYLGVFSRRASRSNALHATGNRTDLVPHKNPTPDLATLSRSFWITLTDPIAAIPSLFRQETLPTISVTFHSNFQINRRRVFRSN